MPAGLTNYSRRQLLEPHVACVQACEQAECPQARRQLPHVGVEADIQLNQACQIRQANRQHRQEVMTHIQMLQAAEPAESTGAVSAPQNIT